MKVLGIMASPRIGGNIDRMVDAALKGASDNGALTEKIILCKKKILPCNGCMVCRNSGRCVIDDDMQNIYEMVTDYNCFVIGSPIYHQNVSCYLKNFFDRLTGTIVTYRRGAKFSRLPESRLRDKRALVITSMNASFPVSLSYMKNFRRAVRCFTDFAHIEVIDFLAAQNTWIKKSTSFLQEDHYALVAGKRLISGSTPLSSQIFWAVRDVKVSVINHVLDAIDS